MPPVRPVQQQAGFAAVPDFEAAGFVVCDISTVAITKRLPVSTKNTLFFFIPLLPELFFIRYLPDGSSVIVRNIDRAIRTLCQTARTILRTTRSRLVRPTREIIRKYFPLAIWLAILERLKDYKIPLPEAQEPCSSCRERQ